MFPALAAAGIAVPVFDGSFLANFGGFFFPANNAGLPSGTGSIALCLSNLTVCAAMTIAAARAT
jgi:hypothetical protein